MHLLPIPSAVVRLIRSTEDLCDNERVVHGAQRVDARERLLNELEAAINNAVEAGLDLSEIATIVAESIRAAHHSPPPPALVEIAERTRRRMVCEDCGGTGLRTRVPGDPGLALREACACSTEAHRA